MKTPVRGFSLVELMITVGIVGILMAVALPSYQNHVVRTQRAAAAGCLMELAQFMERVYAANLRYDQDGGASTALPATACRNELSARYTLGFVTGQPQARTFTLEAVPAGVQASRDTACGTLRINQANVRTVSGATAASACWR